ncbi:Ribonuclease H [Fusarium acutatum]|uniref:Ribonuclease H n=1 Tax=Fusarium acutatum TaxID=78861 RepID=A0A8H4J9S5_9HYPO|nr:Ribonuclease H [Fusarium acutatum]
MPPRQEHVILLCEVAVLAPPPGFLHAFPPYRQDLPRVITIAQSAPGVILIPVLAFYCTKVHLIAKIIIAQYAPEAALVLAFYCTKLHLITKKHVVYDATEANASNSSAHIALGIARYLPRAPNSPALPRSPALKCPPCPRQMHLLLQLLQYHHESPTRADFDKCFNHIETYHIADVINSRSPYMDLIPSYYDIELSADGEIEQLSACTRTGRLSAPSYARA